MTAQLVDVADLASALEALGAPNDDGPIILQITISSAVPGWLGGAVAAASAVGAEVVALLAPDASQVERGPEGLAGWEIGVLTALERAGIRSIAGVAPQRVARVRAVVGALAVASAVAPASTTEVTA